MEYIVEHLEELVRCCVCLERFKTPKFLKCYHTFCAPCIDKLIQSVDGINFFDCPVCRQHIFYPPEGAEKFQNNLYIQTLIDLLNYDKTPSEGNISCDLHSKDVKDVCIDCEKEMCTVCTSYHKHFCSSHAVLSLSQMSVLRDLGINVHENNCCYHKARNDFVCMDCNRNICRFCIVDENHRTHIKQNIESVAQLPRQKLDKIQSEIRPIIDRTIESIKTMDKELQDLEKKVEKAETEIYSFSNLIKNLIDQKTEELIRELLERKEGHKMSVMKIKNDLENSLDVQNKLQQNIQLLKLRCKDSHIIRGIHSIEEQWREILAHKSLLSTFSSLNRVAFEREEDFLRYVENVTTLGEISFESKKRFSETI